MLILQSFDNWAKVALFDPSTGELYWKNRTSNIDLHQKGINGAISRSSLGRTLILYRHSGSLFFRVGNHEIELTDGVETKIETILFYLRRCTITKDGRKLFSIIYRRHFSHLIPLDPTMIEEDHVDFCLYIHHIVSDPKKRARIYQK